MKSLLALALLSLHLSTVAATLEIKVDGLNCELCSDAMKASMLKATEGRAVEPKLECGVIFLETDKSPDEAKAALTWTMLTNGFNMKGVEPSLKSMDEARGHTC